MRRRAVKSFLAATVPPLIAFAVQALSWSILSPLLWFLFYPAVFISSGLGGVASGVGATFLSTAFVTWYFAPPKWSFAVELKYLLSAGVFMTMGITFSLFHERLRRANRAAADALAASQRLNERLRQSEERFRLTVETVVDYAIFMLDPKGIVTSWNLGAERLKGYDADEIVGRHFSQFYQEEDVRAGVCDRELEHAARVGRFECEGWRVRKDGSRFWANVVITAVRNPIDGTLVGFSKVTSDLTDRRIVEEALRESEERFRLTVDGAPIGMALVALDGRFVRVNRALCEIVGYEPEELIGLRFQAITHPDDLDADLALAGQLARGELPRYQLGKRYLRKDGTIVDIMLSTSILRGRDGAPLYYISQVEDITERKRAEEALRRSESQFRGLIEHMPDGVFAYRGGRIAYANDAFAGLLGYDNPAALAGMPIDALLHPDDRHEVAERLRGVLDSGLPAPPREFRMVGPDGSYRSVETVGLRARFEGQSSIVVIVRDLTERKRTEEALRISEAKFSGIVSISADAIISIDDDQRITIFNDGAEKVFGYPKAEAIGAPLDLLIPERFRERHRGDVAKFAAGDVTARRMGERVATIAGRRKNGEEFPAEAAISKLQVGDKTILTVALRDVTERKRVEREQQLLAEAGTALAATLDYEQTLLTVAELVVRDFADWCVIDTVEEQEPFRRLRAVSSDPANASLCARLEQLAIDRDRPPLVREVIETRQPRIIEHVTAEQLESIAQGPEHLQLLRTVSPISVMALPLLMRGRLLGTLSFLSAAPSRAYRQSDLLVAEALADRAAVAIENARLYRVSVEATQLRDHVLGIVAHDLRNPLSAILMQATSLKRQGPEPERRSEKPREIIHRAATRMNRLIQDLLDVAHMEAGQLTIDRARLATPELVVEAVELQRPLATSSSLEIRHDLERGVPEVWGDRGRLLQVFDNLIGNAIKFTEPGGRITAGAASRGHDVVFWVSDTGRGIEPESLAHVFDRFWQANKAGRVGAGLGLSITKSIVEAHGGRIWVESTSGRGTTFFFSIPQAPPAGDRPADVTH
ncbi:MAG: PAS domain S-box protein [Gaiellaceae bacterium]